MKTHMHTHFYSIRGTIEHRPNSRVRVRVRTTHGEEGGVEVQHRPPDVAHPLLVDDQPQPREDLVPTGDSVD